MSFYQLLGSCQENGKNDNSPTFWQVHRNVKNSTYKNVKNDIWQVSWKWQKLHFEKLLDRVIEMSKMILLKILKRHFDNFKKSSIELSRVTLLTTAKEIYIL